jgi:hypothetical protein
VTKHDVVGETLPVLILDLCGEKDANKLKVGNFKLLFNNKEAGIVNVDTKFTPEPKPVPPPPVVV